MPRGTYLSDFEKDQISLHLNSGLSFREIGRKINRSHVVVRNFAKNPSAYGEKKSGGPKKKLTKRDERKIIDYASNSMKSLKQIISDCQVNASKSTISRHLKSSKTIVLQKQLSASSLLPRHNSSRLEFEMCRSDRRCRYARVKIGPTSRDVIKYPLIDPKHVEPGDSFFDLSSQTFDHQSNDSEGKDSNSILPTNSPAIEIKEEVMQHGEGTDYTENNNLTNETMATNEQESIGNHSNLTNSYANSSIETLNVPANTASIYVQAPTTSSSAITVKPHLKDSFNPSSFLAQRLEVPAKPKKRRTFANATPPTSGKEFSDPLDENTSSSKDYNSYEEWSKRKKDLLEIELLEMRNYKVKLELWEKEKALQVASSVFTKDIMGNQQN